MGRRRRRKKSNNSQQVETPRIVAVSHADDDKVFIFGYGRYLGVETPPLTLIQYHPLASQLFHNGTHKLVMDNGTIVWGHQCFWGLAEGFDEWVAGREVRVVGIEDDS